MGATGSAERAQMTDTEGPIEQEPVPPRHRADYILERGVWHVSCQVCGWTTTGPVRRQLASLFRFHLRSTGTEVKRTDP